MQSIRLYDWQDKQKRQLLREVRVLSTTNLTRNGKKRIYVWSNGEDEPNYTLYPDYGTAYPDYEERPQKQRIGKIFLYEAVD